MTTVINNPGNGEDSGGGMIVGIIALIVVVAVFIMYVVPMMRNASAPKEDTMKVEVQLPDGNNEEQPAN